MNLEEQLANLDERSEYAQDILNRMPAWIVRWGSSIVLLAMAVMLAMSFFIKYPDIISAPTTLTTELPPLRVIARANGELQLVNRQTDTVKAGELVAIIRNTVNYDQLAAAVSWLDQFDTTENPAEFAAQFFQAMERDFRNLGELQIYFSRFQTQLNGYYLLHKNQSRDHRLQALQEEKQLQQKLLAQQEEQLITLGKALEIEQAALNRLEALAQKKLVSMLQLDEQKTKHLAVINQIKNHRSAIANTQVTLSQLDKEALEIQLRFQDEMQQKQLTLAAALDELRGEISRWKQTYLLISPIDGRIVWANYRSSFQAVAANEAVFTVVPNDQQTVFARIFLPMKNFGKAKVGQRVFIKLDGFPYQEFGIVSGEITNISPTPESMHYEVRVELPNGLTSSHGQTLPFIHEMIGVAEIVTEDLRLVERIFYQLLSAFDQNA